MQKTFGRWLLLTALIAVGAGAIVLRLRRGATEPDARRLAWVATAHQFGPVGYRDPVGAISPDGTSIAYSEGRFLRVRALAGGPIVAFPAGEAQIRSLSWNPDSRTLLANGYQTQTGWAIDDVVSGTRRPFPASGLQELTWSPDGKQVAGIADGVEGQQLRVLTADGLPVRSEHPAGRIGFPAWVPGGELACITTTGGRSRVTIPCGGRPIKMDPDLDVYGPFAFSGDGRTIYLAMASGSGTLDLWAAPVAGGRAERLTSFSRDTYAPSVAADGTVLFKVQSYRTSVAVAPVSGGPATVVTTFQAETPSWDPTSRWIGLTYGTWRRVVDDAHYPDIAQDAGIVSADASNPGVPPRIVQASPSEDQSLCWSPNGTWLAFHSHKDESDDIWLRPAEKDGPVRRLSFLGRGAETGWPRWSPNGRSVLFSATDRRARRTALYVVGVDQDTGAVTSQAEEIPLRIDADVTHAEWLPDSVHFVAVGKEAPGRQVIVTASRDGSEMKIVRRFESEHDEPGLGVSPDGLEVAFIGPAGDGFFQVFRLRLASGEPSQVTTDPSNKTQPAWSPDGRRLAFTVWSYDVQFFSFVP